MIEVYSGLFIGSQFDFQYCEAKKIPLAIVQACKDPYHRRALGYKSITPPRSHPEYYFAYRGNRLILNLVDASSVRYIAKRPIDEAIRFIYHHLSEGNKVLVHCNQGLSRAPAIGMLFLLAATDVLPNQSYLAAEKEFTRLYPAFSPSYGMRQFLIQNFRFYKK
jgi:hypothetical protein